MKRLDRVLCLVAGVFGLGAFVAGVTTGRSLTIAVGICALCVGLVTASFATWRMR